MSDHTAIDPASTTVELQIQDNVALLTIGDDENRFSPEWLTSVEKALDEVVASGPVALVTTATGKFFSNGLDLQWVMANPEQMGEYVARVEALLARFLTLPVPTVAAVTGHAFGAGAMLAMAHDFRVMREDRGYFCFPEIDINIPFTPGMAALIQGKLNPQTALLAMTTGHRFGGPDAASAGLVDRVAAAGHEVEVARGLVQPLAGKDSATLGAIKATMFTAITTALTVR
jgi:enoyl-CoA hydratase/carnithine racemase